MKTSKSMKKQECSISVVMLFLTFFLSTSGAFAQSLTSESFGFTSGFLKSDAGSLTISGGEVISPFLENESVSFFGGVVSTFAIVPTSIHNESFLPTRTMLYQNYPNPFNPSTNIVFDLPSPSKVRITVYNTLGMQVAVLEAGERSAGQHQITFDASRLASGVYLYALMVDGSLHSTKKMVLIK